ncbi:MAG: DUF512 domain-containing protein [candidate division Zixibacteria bacterium]|nr:DUF512 domain-containing protein [candidate division Zixibacteria bacterium]
MLKITNIKAGSPVFKIGVSIGDELISINGHAINDIIDYRFYQAEHRVALKLARNGKVFFRYLTKDIDSDLGLDFEPDRIIRCRNNCVFCFVHNNPKGLRQTLYIKDDDYRQSFMYGNFVTLTNVSDYEIRRIIKLRLSPIYISVQATDEPVRRLLFGRRRLPPILSVLKELAESNIYFHSQVVIVPGYNDGSILDRTAADLAALRPFAQSLAVVPVGLTKFSRNMISDGGTVMPVGKFAAAKLIAQVDNYRKKYGDAENKFAYAADELFIRSDMDFPPTSYYDDYPQIENGVGMVRRFLDTIPNRISSRRKMMLRKKGIWITGRSMERVWQKYLFKKHRVELNLLPITNRFYGRKVTVSGLLAGKDILKGIKNAGRKSGMAILPPNCLNHDDRFIDDYSPQELADKTGLEIVQGTYDFGETIRLIA